MIDTSNISSGSQTFQLNVTDALPENDRHVTPYSITNMIQINEAPKPDPDPDTEPIPNSEPAPSINKNTLNISKDSIVLDNKITKASEEGNIKTLPKTGVNSNTDLSFVLIGIIIISSAVTILYKNR